MQDTNIFIFCQEIPKVYPKSPEYKLVSLEKISEPCELEKICLSDCDDPVLKMEHAYSEGARIHAIWKNYELPKYVGTAHYRRYLEFFDKLPDLDEIFSTHDAIFPKFDVRWDSVKDNYEGCHNIDDLMLCMEVIDEEFPDFSESAKEVLADKYLAICNIFVTTREMFCQWCKFVFGVLDSYNWKMGFKTDLDVCNHVVNNMDKYIDGKGGLPNSATFYQARIHAFLMERLSTIFFHKMAKNPYHCDIILTEVKHNFEKEYFKLYEGENIGDNN